MITVSNGFKKAIKSENREIHGYVDVKYQNNNYSTSVTQTPDVLNILPSDGSSLVQGSKILQKYATLENNYTLLDGSFMVWNENVILSSGYISDNIFESITDSTIIITNNSSTISTKGITIYFKENLPFDFTVTFTDTNGNEIVDNVTNNQSYNYQYIFNEEKNISTISLIVSRVEFPENRLRIAYVDLNISDLYEGDELISFDVEESLDLLIESLPINTCTVNLNNYPDENNGNKFNPINPKGIIQYLNNNVTLEPYVGVLTETNGIEYVRMGVFYLSDWTSNSDGNVTMNGKSVLSKLESLIIEPLSNFFSGVMTTSELQSNIKNTANVNVDFLYYSNGWNNSFLKKVDLIDYLKYVLPNVLYYDNFSTPYKQYRKFCVNRYDTIILKELSTSSVDTISREELTQDVNYNTKSMIKEINIETPSYGIYSNYRNANIIQENYTLKQTSETVWFSSNQHIVDINNFTYSVTSGSGTATLVGNNFNMVCVKFEGTVGSVLSVTCNASISDVNSVISNSTINRDDVTTGDTITINSSDYFQLSLNSIKNAYFFLDKPYKVEAQTMGDPSLEIGDTVSVQTRYTDVNDGYKDMIITKQKFTFNGGLQCTIEGVGD